MTDITLEEEEFSSPFKNLTLYAEVNGQPMRFLLPHGAEQALMGVLAQINDGAPLIMEPLKEGSKIEAYEESPSLH
ncbi:MAG: hypothetical protein ACRBB6_04480 [Neptuniibacter sp.]